jgi:hypothetical protein
VGQSLVDIEQILRMFSEDSTAARKLYLAYMGDSVTLEKADVYCAVEQRILGNEEFVASIKEKSRATISKTRKIREHTLAKIAGAVEGLYGISPKEMRSMGKARAISKGKRMMSLVANEYGYKNKEIAEFIRKDPVVVSRHLKESAYLEDEVEKVIDFLKGKRANVNK